jgi:hypothetical protein
MTKTGLRGRPVVLVVGFVVGFVVLVVEIGVVLFVFVEFGVVLVAGPVVLVVELRVLLVVELGGILILIVELGLDVVGGVGVGVGVGVLKGDADVQPFRAQEDVSADVESVDR